MLPKHKEQVAAIEMRQKGESVRSIAKILGVSVSSVCLWTRDVQLTEKQKEWLWSRGNASYLYLRDNAFKAGEKIRQKWNEIRCQHQEQGRIDARKSNTLHMQGCMLYWAEGSKNSNSLRLANMDGQLLRHFVRFLRHCYQVPNDKIRIIIKAHNNNDKSLDEIMGYWLSLLELPRDSISRIGFYHNRSRGIKKNKHIFGSCEVVVCQAELVQRIFGAIQEYAGFTNPEWLKRKAG